MVPSTVAPPTPKAVKHTSSIMYFLSKKEIMIQHMRLDYGRFQKTFVVEKITHLL